MGSNSYSEVGSASDVSYVDPTGAASAMSDQLNQYLSQFSGGMSNASDINTFLSQADQLSSLVNGSTSQLQQSLNKVAANEAALGGEAALAAMPGAANSGAGMAAFGSAYASPFAQAEAQIAENQLDLTGNLWGQQMSSNASLANSYASLLSGALSDQTSIANNASGLYTPTYEKDANIWDFLSQTLSSGIGSAVGSALGSKI